MANLKQALSRLDSAITSLDKAIAIVDVQTEPIPRIKHYPPAAFIIRELRKIQGRLEGVREVVNDEMHRGDAMNESGSINERD